MDMSLLHEAVRVPPQHPQDSPTPPQDTPGYVLKVHHKEICLPRSRALSKQIGRTGRPQARGVSREEEDLLYPDRRAWQWVVSEMTLAREAEDPLLLAEHEDDGEHHHRLGEQRHQLCLQAATGLHGPRNPAAGEGLV